MSDLEMPEFYDETNPKARKDHRCCECSETIPKGEQYHKIVGKWDGHVSSYKLCGRCQEVREWAAKTDASGFYEYCAISGLYCYLIECGDEVFDFASCPAELPPVMYDRIEYHE